MSASARAGIAFGLVDVPPADVGDGVFGVEADRLGVVGYGSVILIVFL